jgi:homoserine O-acetyltransferase
MTHSAVVTSATPLNGETPPQGTRGWWDPMVGHGHGYGIDLDSFHVVCAAPLGSPHGSTSPLSIVPDELGGDGKRIFRRDFPVICPADQAKAHAYLLDYLGIDRVYAVVGASMGGMQALEFAAQFPDRVHRIASLCSTGHTSPTTVAVRSLQRRLVKLDPNYQDGHYEAHNGPFDGVGLAREMGTIWYRSREEFDERFSWTANNNKEFEVEHYLAYQATKFKTKFDANCYLTLSLSMDLMNLGEGFSSFEEGCLRFSRDLQFMLLPFKSDALIPPTEMFRLSRVMAAQGNPVHCEALESTFGHDAFLIEFDDIVPRMRAFLDRSAASGVESVSHLVQTSPN